MSLHHYPRIVSNGLVLCLDAANPSSYPGTGSVWNDLSGNNNSGTLANEPTFSSENKGSIVFDGANDYINAVTATSLGINSVSTGFTISIWFKTSGGLEYYLFDNYNGSNDISLRVDAGVLEVYMVATTGAINAVQFGPGPGYNNNVWHNFTITWNGSNLLAVYANGINIGNNTTTLSGSFESNAAFRIGSRPVSPGFFAGNIAQVSVYNRPLSPSDIRQNYNATKGRYSL